MRCDFTLPHFQEICHLLMEHGYRFISFGEDGAVPDHQRVVLLRHDIDVSLESALIIAELEHSLGLKSTYFVWIGAPFYNVFDPVQSRIIRQIQNLGHEIGLHFDETAYGAPALDDLRRAVDTEARTLATVIGRQVRAISLHRPSQRMLDADFRLPHYVNAYQGRFFKEYKYLSDSARRWREGCVCTHVPGGTIQRLHLVVHPFWWTDPEAAGVTDRVNRFLAGKLDYMTEQVARNISTYVRHTVGGM